jgi:hypothetical protein
MTVGEEGRNSNVKERQLGTFIMPTAFFLPVQSYRKFAETLDKFITEIGGCKDDFYRITSAIKGEYPQFLKLKISGTI